MRGILLSLLGHILLIWGFHSIGQVEPQRHSSQTPPKLKVRLVQNQAKKIALSGQQKKKQTQKKSTPKLSQSGSSRYQGILQKKSIYESWFPDSGSKQSDAYVTKHKNSSDGFIEGPSIETQITNLQHMNHIASDYEDKIDKHSRLAKIIGTDSSLSLIHI